jgi:hypothetical protein
MADLNTKIKAFIDDWGIKVQQSAIDVLTKTVAYSTGTAPELVDSIRTNVEFLSGGGVRWTLSMKDYWQFIEFGVDGTEKSQGSKFKFKSGGKPIPKEAMEKFIDTRGITFKSLKKYGRGKGLESISLKSRKKVRKSLKDLTYEQEKKTLSFILGRSIKKHGIKPRPFRSDIITPELKKELYDGLREIYKQEIIATFKED